MHIASPTTLYHTYTAITLSQSALATCRIKYQTLSGIKFRQSNLFAQRCLAAHTDGYEDTNIQKFEEIQPIRSGAVNVRSDLPNTSIFVSPISIFVFA